MISPDDKTRTLPVGGRTTGAARDVAALMPGDTIFEYRIERMLGGGGFGITYLAQDVNLEQLVAIKEYFPADLAVRQPDLSVQVRSEDGAGQFKWGLERFLDEARALASFRHPNIIRVLRYFRENGTAYIVMEYESGEPLKRWMAAQQQGLDQPKLLAIAYPLLDGLEAVHQVNFLHRDIKPDNIYIRANGTPVLLDFGAARRVTSGHDMTNIVSPGFAPFEQYHSKGNQGPWTDIYSLGAVMYWMTTGNKPMESASRVRGDPMPKAQDTASRAVFGEALLRSIDWALAPDEAQRPQSVAALRGALMSSEFGKTRTLPTPGAAAPPLPVAAAQAAAASALAPSAPLAAEPPRKNVLGTILFLDVVGYAGLSGDQQAIIKKRFNELITHAVGDSKDSLRIMTDSGSGASICFLDDPEEALQSALLMRDLLLQRTGQKLALRLGLHLGPIRRVFDMNNQVNVLGDGINVAQRIMDFAKPNQIMVSRAYFDVVSRISDDAAGLFEYLGPHMDKHLRSHEIYAVLEKSAVQKTPVAQSTGFEHTATFAALASLTPELVVEIEAELAKAIGPLARVLVKKAIPRTVSAQGLRDMLSVSIPDLTAREHFLHPKTSNTQSRTNTVSRSGSTTSRTFSPSGSSLSRPVSMSSPADYSRPGASRSQSVKVHNFSAEEQALLERALSQYIGPLARTLVRKEAARQPTYAALLEVLARQIDKVDDRARFIAAAQKFHHGR